MIVKVLASGSKGNVTLIETANTKILIDFGLSYKATKLKLEEVNVNIDEIDAIFITHEHSDHIKGIKTFINKQNVPIYLSKGTYEGLISKQIGIQYDQYRIIQDNEDIVIKDFLIHSFPVSHDAREPFGYVVYEDNKKLVYLTDTGFVSQKVEDKIKDADIYILETNHNVELLMCTNRPWHLKQRILGDFGHLCNEDALEVLYRVKGENTKYVYLAHISEEANNHDLIKLTVDGFCQKENNHFIKFFIAFQHMISEIVEV
jgi:phosphoribosyl 1,2-cyclic phosphodiesterase